jgi:TPP-dependent pyruvate/acetoin dehydrogenase alpha subunit
MMHLGDGDRIASTHRGHGHCIAKGVDVVAMMKPRSTARPAPASGKGGSMHIADLDKGMMGANGIVGAGAPLVCGAALAAKFRGKGEPRSGDQLLSATAPPTRAPFEAMNLAAVWKLPVIFVVENNGYAEATEPRLGVAQVDIMSTAPPASACPA